MCAKAFKCIVYTESITVPSFVLKLRLLVVGVSSELASAAELVPNPCIFVVTKLVCVVAQTLSAFAILEMFAGAHNEA